MYSSPHQELNLGVSVLLKRKLHVWHGLVNKGAQILDHRLHPVQETLPFLSHVTVGLAKLPEGLTCLRLSLSGSNQLKYLTKLYRMAGTRKLDNRQSLSSWHTFNTTRHQVLVRLTEMKVY